MDAFLMRSGNLSLRHSRPLRWPEALGPAGKIQPGVRCTQLGFSHGTGAV